MPVGTRAMYRALFAAADTFVHYRLGPEAGAQLRSDLTVAPAATRPDTPRA